MPYFKTHYYMLALLLVTVVAFWPSYFGMLADAPVFHHLHGITGTLWILLIASQSYAIQTRRLGLHRSVGKVVFVLLPVMVAAFALVTWLGAQKSQADHPFYVEIGHALLTGDAMLTFATPLLVYLALLYRRNVHLHAALMISTVFGLLPPIIFRLIAVYVPGLKVEGLDMFYRFEYSLHLSIAITLAIAFTLYFRHRANGWPWLLVAGITVLMDVLYLTLGQTNLWTRMVQHIAAASPPTVGGFGFALGALACFLGWRQGSHRAIR
jgi:hypothetical protein